MPLIPNQFGSSLKILREVVLKKENQNYKQKNKDYKNALIMFRDKINEVDVFNANLAYSTKLFTEHTTSKKEKINVLRRFDNVETLTESKRLFKQLNKNAMCSKSVISTTLSLILSRFWVDFQSCLGGRIGKQMFRRTMKKQS